MLHNHVCSHNVGSWKRPESCSSIVAKSFYIKGWNLEWTWTVAVRGVRELTGVH